MSDLSQLSKIVDDHEYLEGEDSRFNGIANPLILLLFPENTEQISEALKFCNKSKIPVVPMGSGTKLFFGNNISDVKVIISLKNMNRLLSHEVSDLVATVECGMPIKKFQSSLKRKGQILPVNSQFEDNATVGGTISTNLSGPLSTRYGSCRELLLGIRGVRADGEIINCGAKVVKNVAGYDIPKLTLGALGTLCVLTEATLRLYPKQESSKTAVMVLKDNKDIAQLFKTISEIDIIPSSFEIIDKNIVSRFLPKIKNSSCILFRVESLGDAVEKQIKTLHKKVGRNVSEFFEIEGRAEINLWRKISEFPFNVESELTCRTSLPVEGAFKIIEVLEEITKSMKVKVEFLLRPQRGIVLFSMNGSAEDVVHAASLVRSEAKALKGAVVFTSVSDELHGKIDIFDNFGNSSAIMKNLKKHFDPNNILSPGRLF